MNKILVLMVVLVLAVFLVGCQQEPQYTGYAASGQGQQQPYVGGGCGVAPADDTGDAADISSVSTNRL
jgi:hypothetical protein|tara:strand:+ start:832 stop:1035 length:204 start_codon:yes stop_codon:yes gene_type:complete